MPWFDIQVEGVKEALARLEKIKSRFGREGREEFRDELMACANIVEREIQMRRPRKYWPKGPTGHLQKGIQAGLYKSPIAASFVRVDYNIAPHAHLLEFGTRHAPAYPFFRPGVEASADQVLARIERIIELVLMREAA